MMDWDSNTWAATSTSPSLTSPARYGDSADALPSGPTVRCQGHRKATLTNGA